MAVSSALVTGGVGMLGRAIVQKLRESHPTCRVSVLDLVAPTKANLQPDVKYFQVDITSAEETSSIVAQLGPDLIIHTAGVVPPLHARYGRDPGPHTFKVNVDGTKNILAAAQAKGVKALVYTSSVTVVFDDLAHNFRNVDESVPRNTKTLIYGESKAEAERLVLEASSPSLATCALRPSIIIGAGDTTTIPAIHSCIAKGETFFRIGSGDNLCEFTYVDNVADAHVLAAENLLSPSPTAAGEAFFITNGQPVAFRDFCLAVWAEFGHVPAFEIQVPETLASFVGYVAEWASWVTGRPVTLSRGSVKDYCGVRYANISKAERMLGYRPRVDLAEGLRRSCQAYKEKHCK